MQLHPMYHSHFVLMMKCDLDFAFLISKMLGCNILFVTPSFLYNIHTINILLNRVFCRICFSSSCDWKGHCCLISIIVIKDGTVSCFFFLPKPLGITEGSPARKHFRVLLSQPSSSEWFDTTISTLNYCQACP